MLTLFNTRSNRLEKFEPPFEQIGIYTCGPTVYNIAHIGNLRTFFWSDFIVGIIDYLYGKRVHAIMNITDIDDKILSKLPTQSLEELLNYTQYYTKLFFEDLNQLAITRYNNHHHLVTDNIKNIETMIKSLMEKDYAYRTSDQSIYFDTTKIKQYPFPNYKKENISDSYESSRKIIKSDHLKDKARDFVLWKVKDNEFIDWDIEMGKGRPGWHIECSAISSFHLPNVTLHLGGEDLIFPHHTCEILQSETYDSKKFGQYWSHIGFLNIKGDKMSKSIGNVLYLKDVKENYFLLRFYFFTKHYRSLFDFTLDDMLKHKIHFLSIHHLYSKLKIGIMTYNNSKELVENIFQKIMDHVLLDFNTPGAIKVLIQFVNKYIGKQLSIVQSEEIINQLDKVNSLFKILDQKLLDIPIEIIEQLKQREIHRKEKQYDLADQIRQKLTKEYNIEDYNHGVSIIHI